MSGVTASTMMEEIKKLADSVGVSIENSKLQDGKVEEALKTVIEKIESIESRLGGMESRLNDMQRSKSDVGNKTSPFRNGPGMIAYLMGERKPINARFYELLDRYTSKDDSNVSINDMVVKKRTEWSEDPAANLEKKEKEFLWDEIKSNERLMTEFKTLRQDMSKEHAAASNKGGEEPAPKEKKAGKSKIPVPEEASGTPNWDEGGESFNFGG